MKKLILALALLLPNFGQANVVQTTEINLTSANTVNFRGPVTDESTAAVMLDLIEKVTDRGFSNYPIYLVLDSPGGSIEAGDDFISLVRTFKNVHTISIFSASMAAGIMQALPGKRYILRNSKIMFHRAKGRFQGQFEDGEVESQLALWKKVVRDMEVTNANRIGISLEDYKSKVVNEWWLYGKEAVEQKVADEVVTLKCSKKLMQEQETVTELTFFGAIKLTYSACPLIRVPIAIGGG